MLPAFLCAAFINADPVKAMLIRFHGHVLSFEGSVALVAWAAEDGISDAPWRGLRPDQRRRDGRVARRS